MCARPQRNGAGFASRVSEEPLWTPVGKVDAPRLGAYLARRDVEVSQVPERASAT